jgi:hypothetical protein
MNRVVSGRLGGGKGLKVRGSSARSRESVRLKERQRSRKASKQGRRESSRKAQNGRGSETEGAPIETYHQAIRKTSYRQRGAPAQEGAKARRVENDRVA